MTDEKLRVRLDAGQMFNAYNTMGDTFLVGIGPVTDFYALASVAEPEDANRIVAWLRQAARQPPCLCPVDYLDDDEGDEQ